METVLEDCTAAYDLRVLSLRYFNPIGADPQLRTGLQTREPTHLLGQLVNAAENGEEFALTGDDLAHPRRLRNPRLHPHLGSGAGPRRRAAPVRQVLPAGGERRYEVINLGTGAGTTVREFVAAFQSVSDKPLRVREAPPRPGDGVGSYTRIDKARAILGWEPRFSIADGIRDSIRWAQIRDSRLD